MKKIALFLFAIITFAGTYANAQKVVFYKEKRFSLDSISSYSSIDFVTAANKVLDPLSDTSSALILLAESQIRNEIGFWKNISDHGHMHEGKEMFGVKVSIIDGGTPVTNPTINKKLTYPTSKYVLIDIIQDDRVVFRGLASFESLKINQNEREKLPTLIRAILNKFITK